MDIPGEVVVATGTVVTALAGVVVHLAREVKQLNKELLALAERRLDDQKAAGVALGEATRTLAPLATRLTAILERMEDDSEEPTPTRAGGTGRDRHRGALDPRED